MLLNYQAGCNKADPSTNKQGKAGGADNKNDTKQKKQPNKIKLDLTGLPKTNGSKEFSPDLNFTEIQDKVGIDFVYQNGQKGFSLMVETTGSGSAWIDFDLDGQPDIFLCQGGDPTKIALSSQPQDVLYRQFSPTEFLQIESLAGINEHNYSQGVSAGDFDGDGFDDLYVTNCGKKFVVAKSG